MFDEFLKKSTELTAKGEIFAVATVVRSQAPSSGKQGDRAIVHADGQITGWIGGGCAQPVVVKESLKAMKDGQAAHGAHQPLIGWVRGRRGGLHHDMPQRRRAGHIY